MTAPADGRGHLYGLRAIAAHLDVCPNTVKAWIRWRALLAYKRKRHDGRIVWYSNSDLLARWETMRALADQARARK